jgi:hypothetical protein
MKRTRGLIPQQTADRWLQRSSLLLCSLILVGGSSRTFGAATLGNGATMEVLGIGTAALLGHDLTDPENNGDELLGPDDPSWNWLSISSSAEPGFDSVPVPGSPAGTERAYNVFDNVGQGGGANKWCCGEPNSGPTISAANPLNITVQLNDIYRLTHFTITSGNDTPGRDPKDWQILGSNDGITFEPIFTQVGADATATVSLWGTVRDQVIKFTLDTPAKAYSYFRFECTATYITVAGAFFQITEIEYFGLRGPADLEEKTIGIGTAALLKSDKTDPDNNGNKAAGPTDASWNWKAITANNKPAFGTDGAFNVFDNSVDGLTNKWCCDDATAANPLNVTVEFTNGLVITHFTISSADGPSDGDPTKFQVLGSNDGITFTPFYTRDNPTSLWTARNQVAQITLKDPTPPYKFIRYQATETPGATHQISEIEYFGKFGGLSNPGVSGVIPSPAFLALRVTDGADTTLEPASVQLLIDATNVTYTLSKITNVTTIVHTHTPLFLSGSVHTYAFTAKDNLGNDVTRSGSFTTPTYTTIPAAYAIASVDTTKPGFKVKVHQMDVNRNPGVASIPNAERQITGGYIDPGTGQPYANSADLSTAGPDGFLIETDTINYNELAPAASGFFSVNSIPPMEDKPVPGIGAGTANFTERYVESIETILELKAGHYRLGLVSNEGSRLSFGRGPGDVIGTQITSAGGTVNTTVDVVVPVDGFFPVRLLWFETAGGAECEFFVVDVLTGTRTLINDLTAGSPIKAFRESTVSRPYVSRVLPTVNYGFAFADQDLIVDITDGAIPVLANSIVLTLNNAAVAVTPAKVGNVTTIRRPGSIANLLPSGANTVNVIYAFTEGGNTVTVTNTYSYTVPPYQTVIPAANKVLSATQVTGSGFHMRAHQIDRSLDTIQANGGRYVGNGGDGNRMPRMEIQLNNGYINAANNQPFPNLSKPGPNPDGSYDIDILNLNFPRLSDPSSAPNTGIFQGGTDTVFPGMPGTGTSPAPPAAPGADQQAVGTENSVHEFTTYLDLKAGAYIFGVNSDDGFVLRSSPNPQDTLGTLVGFFTGGRGNTGYPLATPSTTAVNSFGTTGTSTGSGGNSAFNVIVPEDGIYPFRLLYWQGGGGNNLEFLAIDKGTGQHVLVNDVGGTILPTTGGAAVGSPITAFSGYTGPVRPWVKFPVYPMPARWDNVHQQTGPGPITVKVGPNPTAVGNNAGNTRPFGDAIGAVIADVGAGTVGMLLDGTNVTSSLSVTTINSTDKLVTYTPNPLLASGSTHTAGLIYAGTTNFWTFIVIAYTNVAASDMLLSSAADPNAVGFHVKVAQASAARPGGNTAAAAEAQLAGTPANVATNGPNSDGSYSVPGIINLNVTKNPGGTPAENGNFQPLFGGPADDPVPGIPGTGLSGAARFENIAAEIFAYLDLPAGYQRFGVNGDDGWKVQVGTPGQTNGTVLFTIDRGAGSADTPFAFITPQAGLVPVRLVWYQGVGEGNVEFFTYGANGTKIPINDRSNPSSVKAYYNVITGTELKFTSVTLTSGTLTIDWTGTGTLQEASVLSGSNNDWNPVQNPAKPYSVQVGATGQKFYRLSNP